MAIAGFNTGGIDDFGSGADIAPAGGADFQVALGDTSGAAAPLEITASGQFTGQKPFTPTGSLAGDVQAASAELGSPLSPGVAGQVADAAQAAAPGTDGLYLNTVVDLGDGNRLALFDSNAKKYPDASAYSSEGRQTVGAAVLIGADGSVSTLDNVEFYGGSRGRDSMAVTFGDPVTLNGTTYPGGEVQIGIDNGGAMYADQSFLEATLYTPGGGLKINASSLDVR